MISRHYGGELVKVGAYWNPRTGDWALVSDGDGVLPGGPEDTYLKVPLPLMLLIGPLLGLLYVIFLPLAAPVILLRLGARRAQGALARAWRARALRHHHGPAAPQAHLKIGRDQ